MIWSLSSFLITLVISTILIIYLCYLLRQDNKDKFTNPRLINLLIILIVLRLCIPAEMPFAVTIPLPLLMNPITEFLRMDLLGYPLYYLLIFIWIVGSCVMLFRYFSALEHKNLCLDSIRKMADKTTANLLLNRPELEDYQVYISKFIASPQIISNRKEIYLPGIKFDYEDLENVLEHEITHINHFDYNKKQGINILVCIFWWFPPIYFLKNKLQLAIEIATDERVVASENELQSLQYAQSLLRLHKALSTQKSQPVYSNAKFSQFYIADGSNMVEYRVNYLLNRKSAKKKGKVLFLFLLLLPVLMYGVVFEPIYTGPRDSDLYYTEDLLQEGVLIQHKDGTYTFKFRDQEIKIENPQEEPFSQLPVIME